MRSSTDAASQECSQVSSLNCGRCRTSDLSSPARTEQFGRLKVDLGSEIFRVHHSFA